MISEDDLTWWRRILAWPALRYLGCVLPADQTFELIYDPTDHSIQLKQLFADRKPE